MYIKNLFKRDIARPINGVVKADQLDDASIWQELDEYVVTKELDQHLRRFFESYLAATGKKSSEAASSTGVWVSGFFGSGKSHFLKILSYLLQNRAVEMNGETKRAVEFFDGKVADPILFADIKRAVGTGADVVLFNIDSKANPQDERGAVLAVFLRVFNEMLGLSGDHPHIARMERYLLSQGKLVQFHEAFKTARGKEWVGERDAYEFNQDEMVTALSVALGQSEAASRQWLERAETSFPLNPENFAKWVKEYLDSKGPDHRILFLADEIGQFIGADTHLMLSLQTIVENLGTVCGGRAWVVVTSQENIDAVIGEVKASKANDFSKIQGRFKTRLSLSSVRTDEVIQERLLSKTAAADVELRSVFASKGDILKNQLSFSRLGMTMKRIDDDAAFASSYPFVPYQFQLVQRIFEDIRKHGATGLHLSRGERSMLNAFQDAATKVSTQTVGSLVPLYRFYPSIESFLDTAVKRTIDQAIERDLEEFDVEILRVLFLVRYVDEFKASVDNLVTLCIDEIDADRLALRRKVEESLLRLERETLISRNGEDYFFLTNEERDITREIKNEELSGNAEAQKLGELIFNGVLKGNNKHRYAPNKKDFGFNRYCDAYPIGQIMQANDLIVSMLSPLNDEYEIYNESRCIMDSTDKLLVKLGNRESLGRELRLCLQTDQYIRRKNDDTLPPATKRILSDRQHENHQREARLVALLETMLSEADYYVAGQTRTVKAASAATTISEQLTYLIENTYSKLGYLKALKDSPEACRVEIQAVLRANDIGQQSLAIQADDANKQAIDDIRSFIDLSTKASRQTTLADLVDKYAKRPYGWPEFETVLLLARLMVLGEVSIATDGATVAVDKAYDPLSKTAKWRTIIVVKRKTVDSTELQCARKIGMDVFGAMGPDSEEGLFTFLREKLTAWQTKLKEFKPLADTGRYPGRTEIDGALTRINGLLGERASYEFIEKIIQQKDDLLDMCDEYHELDHFYDHQKPTWDRLKTAADEFAVNRSELEKDAAAAAALSDMAVILKSVSPYGKIKDADGLIGQVRAVNTDIIQRRRERVLEKIDVHIKDVEREIDLQGVSSEVSNKCLYPLQQLRKKVESETSIGNIQLFAGEAIETADRALDLVEKTVRTHYTPTQKTSPTVGEGKKDAEIGATVKPPISVVKPRRTVTPSSLMKKTYLETEADVKQFLDDLSTELTAALAENARIQIR